MSLRNHFTVYVVCNSTQHINSFLGFMSIAEKVYWKFRIGILLIPNQDSSLPQNFIDIPRNVPVLVDNGTYRNGHSLPVKILVKTLERLLKLDFEDVKLVLPDVIENPYRTVYLVERSIKEIPKEYYQYLIPALQGSNLQEYLLCFKMLKNTLMRSRVKSIFNLSRIIAIGGLKMKRPKLRIEIVSKVQEEVTRYRPGNKRLKIHVLGCDLYLLRFCYRLVNSIDTANWTYNATTGHGVSIITHNRKLSKLNLYVPDVSNNNRWNDLLVHELFIYLYLVNLIVSDSDKDTKSIQELYVSNVSSTIQAYIQDQVIQYIKNIDVTNDYR